MIFKLSVLFSLFAAASANCGPDNNVTCLEVYAWDMYGDGWAGAKIFLEEPGSALSELAPTCDENPVEQSVCYNGVDGQWYMTAQNSVEGETPENYWEVFWTVGFTNCNGTSLYYTGGYNTTMVWEYNKNDDTWSLSYFENLWPSEAECDSCGDAKACKPKPKPKGHKGKGKGVKTGGSGNGKTSKNSTDMINGPRYGPPAVNLQVTMYDDVDGDGWFSSDYHGVNWYIADNTRTELFFSGTLCDGWSGFCRICLGDGSYTYRVTGEYSNATTWDFCGVTGEYSEELTFHVKKGKCIPDSLVTKDDSCNNLISSTVTLQGVVALTGIPSELLDASYGAMVTETLASEISGWELTNMETVSTSLDSREVVGADRKLSVFTHDVTFEVSFESEKTFGVDGRDYRALTILARQLSEQVDANIAAGTFLNQLTTSAISSSSPLLANVQGAELLSLKVVDVEFTGTKTMKESTMAPYESDATVSYFDSYDIQSIAIFCGALAVGFLAFIGVMTQGMNGYRSIATEGSEHTPVNDVVEAEMDTTLDAPRFASFSTEKVETTI